MLIMYAGYFAYSLYSASWQKQSHAFWKTTDKGVNLTSLYRVIESTASYIALDSNKQSSIYFAGNEQTLNFVATSPIFTNTEALVQLTIIDNSLIYKESELGSKPLLTSEDNRVWQHSIVLLAGISDAKFDYYGWNSIQQIKNREMQQAEQIRGETIITPSWYSVHTMARIRILPIKLSLTYTDEKNQNNTLTFTLPQHSHFGLFRYLREDI